MNWMLSIWVAAALLAVCMGQNTVHEVNSLSASGYHLCTHNETRIVTSQVMHKVPYTVTKPCGGWLLWETCTVTLYKVIHQTENKTVMEQVTRCCDGYVQVGRYCALPVNRSGEFTAKPGSCPTADGLCPGSKDCEWDMDCPGWQKCCKTSERFLCSDPASSSYYPENGGYRFNATVTVKADYEKLMSEDRGHLNHARLLQAMVTGALQSNVSVYYLSSWPVHPYRTATSLLISCSSTLSLHTVTSMLHLLLKHIQEVSSVTVKDVDECAESVLRQCSPQADCNNTVGSYLCVCRHGYIDVDPSNPGAHCTADVSGSTTTEPPPTYLPPMSTTTTAASSPTRDPQGNGTTGPFSSTETRMTTALSNTSPVPYNSSHAPQWTSSASSTSMSSTTTCSPPNITSLWSANVTGASFCVYWSSQFQINQTYLVVVSNGSGVIHSEETNQMSMLVKGLKPGVLYNVTVTPCACGRQGPALHTSVRTDALTLDATARLTNIQFSADLQNTSSQAYKNLTESITLEIYQSLSPEMKAMVDSGQVRIEISGFSPGSVVVNFTFIFTPTQTQDINNVPMALLNSLMNSTKYTVDENSTSVNDFNECTSGENDCSQWATCTNTMGSYTCDCLDGFTDANPERPGRACQAIATLGTTPDLTPTILSTISTTPFSQILPSASDPALMSTVGKTTVIKSAEMVSSTGPPSSLVSTTSSVTQTAVPVVTIVQPVTTSTTVIITTAPTTAPTTTTTAPTTTTTTTTTPTTTTTAPTTTTTTTTPTTTTTAPTTTTSALTTTTTNSTVPPTNTTVQTTTITPITPTTTPLTTTTSMTTTTIAPVTTITVPTTIPPQTTSTTPLVTTSTLTTTTTTAGTTATTTTTTTTTVTAMSSMTSPPTTTATSATTTAPSTNGTALRTTNTSTPGAISVQCRLDAITVTLARDFLLKSKIRESSLYLGLLECGVNGGNATHAQLTVAWNECDTMLVHNDTYYTASVTLFNTMDQYVSSSGALEVPKIRLEVPIMCAYLKSTLISADFGSMGHSMIQDIIMGSGSFQVTVQLMNGTVPLPYNYSLSPSESVVVEVSLNTSSEQIKVVINKCWATPTQSPLGTASYIFLDNSCSLNEYTNVLANGNSSTSRVSVQIFSLVNLNVIYLHCQVQVCVQIGSDSCVPDCNTQRTARSSNTIGTAFGSSGPLLRANEESLEEELTILNVVGMACLGIGLSLFFIIGFVCLFYYQRNRIGHYNFSSKPKQENFTYLVFNT